MSADVIVVGGGYSGLTAAAILAHNGLKVEVLEATGHLGGRSAFDRKDGFLVDYGIHFNSYGSQGPAAKALRMIGHEIEFISPGKPMLFKDGEFTRMPTGVGSFFANSFISSWEKFLIGHGVRRIFLRSTTKLADVPLKDALPGMDKEPVREFFRYLSGLGLVAPDIEVASTGEFIKFLRRALKAREQVSLPKGGTSQIINALSKKISENGEIKLNSRVKALDVVDGKVKSLKVKDSTVSAPVVLHSAPVQGLPDLVGDSLPVRYLKQCSSIIPTAGLSVDLCLNQVVSDLDGFIITDEPFAIGAVTSNIDPTTAPEGKQLITFCNPLPFDLMHDRARVDEAQDKLMSLLERMFPGIMDDVAWERVLRLKMIDGFEPRIGQTIKDRPAIKVPYVENLFLAGDAVAVEGRGGDVAFQAGMESAAQVLEFLG